MNLILGLNAFHPDSSACVLRDGQLVAAVAEERLGLRHKHVAGFPGRAIAEVLRMEACRRKVPVLFCPHEHIG
jgi:carbamoyltransferase